MKSLNNYTARVQAAIIALFLIIALFSALSGNAQAQVKQTNDGNYIAVKQVTNDSATYQDTGKTFTDTRGNKYPVMVSSRGKLFVIRTSKNTGNKYRYYLPLKTN